MADLAAVTPTDVKVVRKIELESGPAGEPINAGEVVAYNALTGAWVLGDANANPVLVARGVAVTTANVAGIALEVLKKGVIDVGSILDGLNFGDAVFPSGTPGLLADAVVNAQPAIGDVVPAWGTTTADKHLRVNC